MTESLLRDPKDTTLGFLIRSHCASIRDELDFDPASYRALAAELKLNIFELGALIRINPSQVELYLSNGKFPAPVEFSLYMIRQALISRGCSHHGFPRLPIDSPLSNPQSC